jgi:ABC-2 type transport system permease protein
MKTLGRYLRLYFLISSQYIKARMSYRADFIISIVGMAFANVPSFLGLYVIFANIPSLAGWSLDELLFIYGFTVLSMSLVQVVFDNIWQLRWKVQDGSFIKYYFRPLNMMFYYMSEVVDIKGLPQIAFGIFLTAWSSAKIGIVWTLGRVMGSLCMLVSASLVMTGLMTAASSLAFWIVNSFSLLMLVSRMRDYARYPLSIFNGFFRIIFSVVVPIGFVAFYPVQWILYSRDAGIVPFLTPVAGIVCFALGYLVWHKGTRRWSGTGT